MISPTGFNLIVTVSDDGSKENAVVVCVLTLSSDGQVPAERTIVNVSLDLFVHFTISLFVTTPAVRASSVRRKGKVDGNSAHLPDAQIIDVAHAEIVHNIKAVALFLIL